MELKEYLKRKIGRRGENTCDGDAFLSSVR